MGAINATEEGTFEFHLVCTPFTTRIFVESVGFIETKSRGDEHSPAFVPINWTVVCL